MSDEEGCEQREAYDARATGDGIARLARYTPDTPVGPVTAPDEPLDEQLGALGLDACHCGCGPCRDDCTCPGSLGPGQACQCYARR